MRSLVWIPLAMALSAAAAWGILRGTGRGVPATELLLAAGITIVAAELAMAPMVLTRGAGTSAVSQASLLGMVVHFFLSITLAGGVYMLRLVPNRNMFLYLLAAFFWVSLVLVAVAAVKAIRQAEPVKKT